MTEMITPTPRTQWERHLAGECWEDGCGAPRRQLLRYEGGTYLSDWCWAHAPRCLLCHGAIDDGEDLCEAHEHALGVRYEHELLELAQEALHTALHARDAEG